MKLIGGKAKICLDNGSVRKRWKTFIKNEGYSELVYNVSDIVLPPCFTLPWQWQYCIVTWWPDDLLMPWTRGRFNIKMFHRNMNSYYKDKTVPRSYLYDGIHISGNCVYWNGAQDIIKNAWQSTVGPEQSMNEKGAECWEVSCASIGIETGNRNDQWRLLLLVNVGIKLICVSIRGRCRERSAVTYNYW